MNKKLKVLLLCIPLYPISIIGEFYETKGNGRLFSLTDHTKEYWKEVYSYFK